MIMRKGTLLGLVALIAAPGFGCKAKATDEQLEEMCKHLLEISGDMRGTSEKEEVSRVEEEYQKKETDLKEEMARDLKGMDDVHAQKLADIEAGKDVVEAPAEDQDEEGEAAGEKEKAGKTKKKKDAPKAEEEAPLSKEDKIKAANEDIEKKKKEITDQFERLIKVLGPQKTYALRDARKYVAKRKKQADETLKKCIEDVKKRDITEEKYQCRMTTDSRDAYFACP
jgi:hypothetical protein